MNNEEDMSNIKIFITLFATMDALLILSIYNHYFDLQTITGIRFITCVKYDGTIYN